LSLVWQIAHLLTIQRRARTSTAEQAKATPSRGSLARQFLTASHFEIVVPQVKLYFVLATLSNSYQNRLAFQVVLTLTVLTPSGI
jgi:hypothetical protein